MKILITTAAIIFATTVASAQTAGTGQRTGSATSQPNGGSSRNSAADQKGTTGKKQIIPKSHGPKDVTPGSPVGTGGAGEGNLAGSPAGSAVQTNDQTEKAEIVTPNRTNRKSSPTRKATTTRSNRRQ
jgi:hypothetical protein